MKLYCLSNLNGKILWYYDNKYQIITSPIIYDNKLLIVNFSNSIYSISLQDNYINQEITTKKSEILKPKKKIIHTFYITNTITITNISNYILNNNISNKQNIMYELQIGVFENEIIANNTINRLKKLGYNAFYEYGMINNQKIIKVLIGYYSNKIDIINIQKKLINFGFDGIIIKKINNM